MANPAEWEKTFGASLDSVFCPNGCALTEAERDHQHCPECKRTGRGRVTKLNQSKALLKYVCLKCKETLTYMGRRRHWTITCVMACFTIRH